MSSKPSTNKQAFEALGALYDALDEAYWAASTVEAKDRIYSLTTVVLDEYNELARKGLAENTEAYKTATEGIKAAKKKLQQLKKEIDQLVHAFDVAAKVVSTLTKVLAFL